MAFGSSSSHGASFRRAIRPAGVPCLRAGRDGDRGIGSRASARVEERWRVATWSREDDGFARSVRLTLDAGGGTEVATIAVDSRAATLPRASNDLPAAGGRGTLLELFRAVATEAALAGGLREREAILREA